MHPQLQVGGLVTPTCTNALSNSTALLRSRSAEFSCFKLMYVAARFVCSRLELESLSA